MMVSVTLYAQPSICQLALAYTKWYESSLEMDTLSSKYSFWDFGERRFMGSYSSFFYFHIYFMIEH